MSRKLVSPLGTAAWSSVVAPRLNEMNGRHEWSLGLICDEEQAMPLLQHLEQLKVDAVARDPQLANGEWFMPVKASMKKQLDGSKTPDYGKVVLSFKRSTERIIGGQPQQNEPPKLYDSIGQPTTGISSVPPGSTIKVIFRAYTWAKAGKKGVSLDLEGVQVGQLAEDMPDLEPIAVAGFADDFATAPVAAAPAAVAAPPIAPPPVAPVAPACPPRPVAPVAPAYQRPYGA
jgi:hypothetical protein